MVKLKVIKWLNQCFNKKYWLSWPRKLIFTCDGGFIFKQTALCGKWVWWQLFDECIVPIILKFFELFFHLQTQFIHARPTTITNKLHPNMQKKTKNELTWHKTGARMRQNKTLPHYHKGADLLLSQILSFDAPHDFRGYERWSSTTSHLLSFVWNVLQCPYDGVP